MKFHSKPNTFVGHVNIKVQDLDRSLTFYQEVLGFQILEQTDKTVKLTTDGKTSVLSIEQPDNVVPKQGKTTGLYHFALLLPKRSDLAEIVHHFMKIGFQYGSSDHLVSEALYLADPDGNGIEIYIDREPSEWTWINGEVAMAVDPLNFEDLLSVGKQQSWKGLPAGTVMGHIHLHVSELEKTEEFYSKGLGFEVVNRFGNQALFISTGKYHHQIALNTWAGVGAPTPPLNSVGLESFTIVLADEVARNNVIAQLKSIGASVTEENGSFITYDPSGNRIYLGI
ncbi:glyoxalase [Sporosarcina sp. P13]|uniref:VOC family protein n=1 Tax=Sporosarcina sp. P13 TaxID=2048263 RepID=UPI000C16BFC4|nr:VOC family protein [Sporosarcina sp. P13]PIC62654.1 glyoxalase [Sporosarcina sp. P13]